MFDTTQFKKLTKEEKILKLTSILEVLKGDGDLFDDLYELLNNLEENISTEFLDTLYETIASAVKNLNNSKLKKDIDKMEKIRQRLKKLKEFEEKERENPDSILEQIENL